MPLAAPGDPHHAHVGRKAHGMPSLVDGNKLHGHLTTFINRRGTAV
jgi:hypothetical protein